MARRIYPAPSSPDDPFFRLWTEQVTEILDDLPQFSSFSTTNPNGDPFNSQVTANAGCIGFYSGNDSSVLSVLWLKTSGSSNTGWRRLQII